MAEASQSDAVAAGFVQRIMARCRKIGDAPNGGRPSDDLEPGLRTVPFESTALTAYRLTDSVEITNVFYGRPRLRGPVSCRRSRLTARVVRCRPLKAARASTMRLLEAMQRASLSDTPAGRADRRADRAPAGPSPRHDTSENLILTVLTISSVCGARQPPTG
ncbi:type II toxin-antitoxin system RelE/ParE family toxin [Mesorhizobium sp. M0991]|uniref:type II toxin-antitoxin system RelE/ParE family toxin n=1 Tax=Mesorhizobium sp. M0991 TaxID=2957043 RepID=UPI00333AE85D